jgi:hypothetical protein
MSSNSGTDGASCGQPAHDAAQSAETQPEAQGEPIAAPAGSSRDTDVWPSAFPTSEGRAAHSLDPGSVLSTGTATYLAWGVGRPLGKERSCSC